MKTKPTPIRIPADLEAEIKAASELTGLPDQEVMRLAMRIGLVDLRAAKNIAGIIQEAATDKGTSFLSWALEKAGQQTPQTQKIPHAQAAASSSTSAEAQSPAIPTAKLAKFPRPTTPEPELKVAEAVAEYKFTDRTKKKGA
mgnify:CR=1 FL=1